MSKLPPLRAIRVFEVAARHLSFTAAAAELRVSHSAVSQQIKFLEDYFGQRLFNRGGRSLSLTQQAAAFHEEVRFALDRLRLASEQMAAESNVRVVRVNATPSFAMRWLIPQLASFQIRQPRTEVRVSTSPFDDIVSLEGDYDVIIRRDTMKRIGYQCHFLINDESLAVTSPSFVSLSKLKHSSDISPGMLLHMKSRPDAWTRWFNSAGLLPVEAISGRFFDHFFLSIEAAINGIGVALAPKVLVEEDIRLGRLVELFPENTVSGSGFHFLSREVGSRRAHLNEFVAWLKTGGNAKRPSVTRSRT